MRNLELDIDISNLFLELDIESIHHPERQQLVDEEGDVLTDDVRHVPLALAEQRSIFWELGLEVTRACTTLLRETEEVQGHEPNNGQETYEHSEWLQRSV